MIWTIWEYLLCFAGFEGFDVDYIEMEMKMEWGMGACLVNVGQFFKTES
jgi:hypothetical protein